MPREVFVAGQILTAAELNSVSDQTVMSFAGTAARGSAIPSPVEGMVTYLEDSEAIEKYAGSAWRSITSAADMPAGSILQVVSATKTNTFSTTSTSYVDLTDMSVSITPTSASSKVLVIVNSFFANNTSDGPQMQGQVLRGATALANNNGMSMAMSNPTGGDRNMHGQSFTYLDSPNTTSATTYKVQVKVDNASFTGYVNRSGNNSVTGSSHITVMEVAA